MLIYGYLETISDSFLYFSSKMGKDQLYPPNTKPFPKNRLFTQYAKYPESECSRTVEEMVQGTSIHCVLFVTTAFGLGFHCNDISNSYTHWGIILNGKYCQKVGRAGRNGLPARANI